MSSYTPLRQLLPGYVCTYRQPDTTELQQYLQAVTSEQRYELVTEVRGLLGTAMHIAALQDHTEIISCILDSFTAEVRYKLLKVQRDKTGRTAIHMVAYNDRNVIHMTLLSGERAAMGCMPERQFQLPNTESHFSSTPIVAALSQRSAGTAALILQYKKNDVVVLDATTEGYGVQLQQHDRTISGLTANNESHGAQLQQLEQKISVLAAKTEGHGVQLQQHDVKISGLEQKFVVMEAMMKEIKGEISQMKQQTQKKEVVVQEAAEGLPAKTEGHGVQLQQHDVKISGLEQKFVVMETMMKEIKGEISQMKQQTQKQEVVVQEAAEGLPAKTEGHGVQLQQHDVKISVLAAKAEGHDVQLQQHDVKISEMKGEMSQVKQRTQKLEVNVQKATKDIPVLGTKTEDHGAQLQQHDVNISALQQQEMEQNTQIKANTEGISKNSDDILQQNNLLQKKPDQPLELTEDGCINPEQEGDSPPTPTGEEVEEEDIDRGIQEIVN